MTPPKAELPKVELTKMSAIKMAAAKFSLGYDEARSLGSLAPLPGVPSGIPSDLVEAYARAAENDMKMLIAAAVLYLREEASPAEKRRSRNLSAK